jgi:hypothetical protein
MNRRESVRARMAKPKKEVSLGEPEYFSFFLPFGKRHSGNAETMTASL